MSLTVHLPIYLAYLLTERRFLQRHGYDITHSRPRVISRLDMAGLSVIQWTESVQVIIWARAPPCLFGNAAGKPVWKQWSSLYQAGVLPWESRQLCRHGTDNMLSVCVCVCALLCVCMRVHVSVCACVCVWPTCVVVGVSVHTCQPNSFSTHGRCVSEIAGISCVIQGWVNANALTRLPTHSHTHTHTHSASLTCTTLNPA